MFKRPLSAIIIVSFFASNLMPVTQAHADSLLGLPTPGTMVSVSPNFEPALIKGLTVHKDNPFLFDFIVDPGQSKLSQEKLKEESDRMIKYFFASLTIPDKDIWVNLSPYEKDRMIAQSLGVTAMGRDLLAQDYMLKQLTASLIYPQRALGKTFWDAVYSKAKAMYGTTEIPVNTFNKVWIVPQKVGIYEHGQTAFIVEGHLKVMLEEDYLSMTKHNAISSSVVASEAKQSQVNQLGSQIIRQIVLPEIEKEINNGRNFATLRQIFYAQALAVWFKHNLKQALLNRVYANKSTVKGIDQNDPATNEAIYQQYLRAYKKGVFNFIKEDIDPMTQEALPRKYFSGGYTAEAFSQAMVTENLSPNAAAKEAVDAAQDVDETVVVAQGTQDSAGNKNLLSRREVLAALLGGLAGGTAIGAIAAKIYDNHPRANTDEDNANARALILQLGENKYAQPDLINMGERAIPALINYLIDGNGEIQKREISGEILITIANNIEIDELFPSFDNNIKWCLWGIAEFQRRAKTPQEMGAGERLFVLLNKTNLNISRQEKPPFMDKAMIPSAQSNAAMTVSDRFYKRLESELGKYPEIKDLYSIIQGKDHRITLSEYFPPGEDDMTGDYVPRIETDYTEKGVKFIMQTHAEEIGVKPEPWVKEYSIDDLLHSQSYVQKAIDEVAQAFYQVWIKPVLERRKEKQRTKQQEEELAESRLQTQKLFGGSSPDEAMTVGQFAKVFLKTVPVEQRSEILSNPEFFTKRVKEAIIKKFLQSQTGGNYEWKDFLIPFLRAADPKEKYSDYKEITYLPSNAESPFIKVRKVKEEENQSSSDPDRWYTITTLGVTVNVTWKIVVKKCIDALNNEGFFSELLGHESNLKARINLIGVLLDVIAQNNLVAEYGDFIKNAKKLLRSTVIMNEEGQGNESALIVLYHQDLMGADLVKTSIEVLKEAPEGSIDRLKFDALMNPKENDPKLVGYLRNTRIDENSKIGIIDAWSRGMNANASMITKEDIESFYTRPGEKVVPRFAQIEGIVGETVKTVVARYDIPEAARAKDYKGSYYVVYDKQTRQVVKWQDHEIRQATVKTHDGNYVQDPGIARVDADRDLLLWGKEGDGTVISLLNGKKLVSDDPYKIAGDFVIQGSSSGGIVNIDILVIYNCRKPSNEMVIPGYLPEMRYLGGVFLATSDAVWAITEKKAVKLEDSPNIKNGSPKKVNRDTITLTIKNKDYYVDRTYAADGLVESEKLADRAVVANSIKNPVIQGGIDLSQQDSAMRITKDANGGVRVDIDPALIARVEREGLTDVDPVIIGMRPADVVSIFGVKI